MSGWRHTLKVEGIPPGAYTQYPHNTHNRHGRDKTVLKGGNSADTAYSAYRTSTLTLPVDTLKPVPAMPEAVRQQLAADSEAMFLHLWRRLANRLGRVMDGTRDRGYLDWTRTNDPELWREMRISQDSWDTNERLETLKAGRIRWRDYRRLMLAWARLHVKAIRRHGKVNQGGVNP